MLKKAIPQHWDEVADRALWEAGAAGVSLEDYAGLGPEFRTSSVS
jgi:hypothetical protein